MPTRPSIVLGFGPAPGRRWRACCAASHGAHRASIAFRKLRRSARIGTRPGATAAGGVSRHLPRLSELLQPPRRLTRAVFGSLLVPGASLGGIARDTNHAKLAQDVRVIRSSQ